MEISFRFKWPISLIVVGIGISLWTVISFLASLKDSGIPISAPGETVVTIAKPGNYAFWNETKTLRDGKFLTFPDDLPSGTTIKVTSKSGDLVVPLRKCGVSSVESSGSRRVAIAMLTFSMPGEYQVVVTGLEEKRFLYLDESKLLKFLLTLMVGGFAGISFMAVGVGVGISLLVRHPR